MELLLDEDETGCLIGKLSKSSINDIYFGEGGLLSGISCATKVEFIYDIKKSLLHYLGEGVVGARALCKYISDNSGKVGAGLVSTVLYESAVKPLDIKRARDIALEQVFGLLACERNVSGINKFSQAMFADVDYTADNTNGFYRAIRIGCLENSSGDTARQADKISLIRGCGGDVAHGTKYINIIRGCKKRVAAGSGYIFFIDEESDRSVGAGSGEIGFVGSRDFIGALRGDFRRFGI